MTTLLRQREPEMMDDPNIEEHSHLHALDGIAKANRLSRVKDILWFPIFNFSEKIGRQPLRILDIGTGSGDIPIALWRRAQRLGLDIQFDGCDLSERCVSYAQEKSHEKGAKVGFFRLDAVADTIPGGYDVIISSQFMHHLDPPDIIKILGKMKNSAHRLVLVNDLRRSYTGLALVWLGSHVITDSEVVRFDGIASVRAAFTKEEWQEMAQKAEMDGSEIELRGPLHLLLSWRRPGAEGAVLAPGD